MLGRYGLGPDSVVVDLGAGTGTFTVAVAPRCRRVVAVDVSPAMTAALRARVQRLGLGNVEVVDMGFLSYEHRREPADVVYTRNALHQLPDFWKTIALHRIASFLRPGGVLRLRDLVFDFAPDQADEHIDAWLAGAVSDPSVGWTAEELAEHVRGEFSTYSWLLDSMLGPASTSSSGRSAARSTAPTPAHAASPSKAVRGASGRWPLATPGGCGSATALLMSRSQPPSAARRDLVVRL